MSDKEYFLISGYGCGGQSHWGIEHLTEKELMQTIDEIVDMEMGPIDFIKDIDKYGTTRVGKYLIIKGKIIIPEKVEVVTKYKLPEE